MRGKNKLRLLQVSSCIVCLLLAVPPALQEAVAREQGGGLTVSAFRSSPDNPIRPLGSGGEDAAPVENQGAPLENQAAPEAGDAASPSAQEGEAPEASGTGEAPPEQADAAEPPIVVPLRETGLRFFSRTGPLWERSFAAKFRESKFPLDRAVNLGMVERFTGRLSKERRKFLQENRFLLIPQEECKLSGYTMLELFDEIGKERFYMNSTIPNALFVGPDPFLHALHGYFSTRFQYLEQTRLSLLTLSMLEGLYKNAATLRAAALPEGAASFERLQAQLLVPLTILASSIPAKGGGVTAYEQALFQEGAEKAGAPSPGSLAGALAVLKDYENTMSPDNAATVRQELEAIFAEGRNTRPSPLFSLHYGAAEGGHEAARGTAATDYSRFSPGGHYSKLPVLRAYYRAARWLGEMGWDLSLAKGAADAMNFALAMSMVPARDEEKTGSRRAPAEDWRQIMELTSFFVGYPSEASYAEWVPYLLRHAGVEDFDQHTATDPHVIARIQAGMSGFKAASPYFSVLQRPKEQSRLRVFPARFSVSRLVTEELSHWNDPERQNLPPLFSSLWIPAVMGSPYALELLEPQVAASLRPVSASVPSGGLVPQEEARSQAFSAPESGQASAPGQQEPSPPVDEVLARAVDATRVGVQRLAQLFGEEAADSWGSSLGAAWLHLLRTLTASPGKDMPLYMQSPKFRAKQLETFLGSYAELRRDMALYDETDIITREGPRAKVNVFHPIPNGFVEPNLPFWHGMIAVADSAGAIFAAHDLLEADRREGGALHSFKQQLLLCAALAEKELRGQPLSRKDYDSLRDRLKLLPLLRGLPGMPYSDQAGGGAVVADLQSTGTHILYGATGRPYIMLVLVGNEQAPRLTVGVAYNHTEFAGPAHSRLSDAVWQDWIGNARTQPESVPPLPPKPFWYDGLVP